MRGFCLTCLHDTTVLKVCGDPPRTGPGVVNQMLSPRQRGPWARRAEAKRRILAFDRRLEGIAAQCPLLLQVEADLRDLFRGQSRVEDAAPDLLALRLAGRETLPDRMRTDARSRALGISLTRLSGSPYARLRRFPTPISSAPCHFAS